MTEIVLPQLVAAEAQLTAQETEIQQQLEEVGVYLTKESETLL